MRSNGSADGREGRRARCVRRRHDLVECRASSSSRRLRRETERARHQVGRSSRADRRVICGNDRRLPRVSQKRDRGRAYRAAPDRTRGRRNRVGRPASCHRLGLFDPVGRARERRFVARRFVTLRRPIHSGPRRNRAHFGNHRSPQARPPDSQPARGQRRGLVGRAAARNRLVAVAEHGSRFRHRHRRPGRTRRSASSGSTRLDHGRHRRRCCRGHRRQPCFAGAYATGPPPELERARRRNSAP
jgi:hypothetical protein